MISPRATTNSPQSTFADSLEPKQRGIVTTGSIILFAFLRQVRPVVEPLPRFLNVNYLMLPVVRSSKSLKITLKTVYNNLNLSKEYWHDSLEIKKGTLNIRKGPIEENSLHPTFPV